MTKKAKSIETSQAEVITASEVAQWLRIPKSTVYKLCQEGVIPAAKIGRHWRFNRAMVAEWMQRRMVHDKTYQGGEE